MPSALNATLIKATVNDWQHLQQISRDTFVETFAAVNTEENMRRYVAEHFNEQAVKLQLENEHSHFYFAFYNDELAGYMKLNEAEAQADVKDPASLEIERIYVLQTAKGGGIGFALFQKAVQLAKDANKQYVWLGVWEENYPAIRFYERQGFKTFDKHVFQLGDDAQRDLMMRLDLVHL